MKTKINSKKPTTNNQQPNTKKGITLVALVVTIVVLIILAGVTLSLTLDHEGIISKSRKAVADYKNAQTNEQQQITAMEEYINQSTGQSVKLISFTIGGATCYAEEGMTWEKWCSSSYKDLGAYISGVDVFLYNGGDYRVGKDGGTGVDASHEIIEGCNYVETGRYDEPS